MAGNALTVAAPTTDALSRVHGRLGARIGWIVAITACGAFSGLLTWFALAQHSAYSTGRQDLEIYTQVIWNTANGRPYETTLLKTNNSHLAEHLAGAVLLIAPLYKLAPTPALLIGIQQLCLGLAGLPIFAFARARTGSVLIALVITGAYLGSGALASIALDDFHAVALAALPLSMSLYYLYTGRPRAALALAVFAMFLEEESSLVVAGAGLMLMAQRHWKQGALWFGLGTVYLALAIFVIMPRFHLENTLPADAPNRSVGHFSELLTRPKVLTDRITGERARDAFTQLALPTGGLSLLQPHLLLPDLPSFAALFLQDRDDTFRRHWAAPMLPAIWMATAAGIGRLGTGKARIAGTLLVIAASAYAYRVDSPLPGGGKHDPEQFERTERSEILDELVSRVPPDARVAASVNFVAHLANRPGVYVFPPGDHYAEGLYQQADRPNAYVLDLFDSTTQRIAATDKYSPLMGQPVYAVWSPGHKAILLLDAAPPSPGGRTATYNDKILLRGSAVRQTPHGLELELQWQKYEPLRGRYARQITILDDQGRVLQREDDMSLSSVFGVNKWQLGQVIVDTYRVRPVAGASQLTARVEWVTRDKRGPILVNDGTRAVEIPLIAR